VMKSWVLLASNDLSVMRSAKLMVLIVHGSSLFVHAGVWAAQAQSNRDRCSFCTHSVYCATFNSRQTYSIARLLWLFSVFREQPNRHSLAFSLCARNDCIICRENGVSRLGWYDACYKHVR
jgi:hypothetical protein